MRELVFHGRILRVGRKYIKYTKYKPNTCIYRVRTKCRHRQSAKLSSEILRLTCWMQVYRLYRKYNAMNMGRFRVLYGSAHGRISFSVFGSYTSDAGISSISGTSISRKNQMQKSKKCET